MLTSLTPQSYRSVILSMSNDRIVKDFGQIKFHIMRLEVDSFKGITARRVDANGNHIVIEGPNGAGKTSMLDAIMFAICGTKAVGNVVKIGHDTAKVKLWLSTGEEYVVISRSVDNDGSKTLTCKTETGKSIGSPQAFLDSLLSRFSLEPMKFLTLPAKEQIDAILRVCNVEPPVKEVEAATGSIHLPGDGESAYDYLMRLGADKTGLYYETRRDYAKEVVQKKKALAEALQQLQDTPEFIPCKPTLEYLKEIEKLQEANKAASWLNVEATAAKNRAMATQETLFVARGRLKDKDGDIVVAQAALDRAIAARDGQAAHVAACFTNHEKAVADSKAATAAAAQAGPDKSAEIAALKSDMASDSLIELQANERRVIKANVERLRKELNSAECAHEQASACLSSLRGVRYSCLEKVDIGIKNLTLGEESLCLNNVPLPAASMAEQLSVAFAVVKKQNPQLGLIRVDEAERLDRHSRNKLFDMADEAGLQVVMAAVSNGDELTVTITE